MPTNTNTEVIDTTTPPQGLFLFQAGGAIEFVTLDSGPSLFEQPAASPWFPLPGYPVGCLVWFNTTTGEKGRVTFPLRLTVPGHYAAGGECVWDVAAASAGDGVGLSVGVCGGVYDGGVRGFEVGRKKAGGSLPYLTCRPPADRPQQPIIRDQGHGHSGVDPMLGPERNRHGAEVETVHARGR